MVKMHYEKENTDKIMFWSNKIIGTTWTKWEEKLIEKKKFHDKL